MLDACKRQFRVGFGGPFALDYGAVFTMAQATGANRALLAEVLPDVERVLLSGLAEDAQGD